MENLLLKPAISTTCILRGILSNGDVQGYLINNLYSIDVHRVNPSPISVQYLVTTPQLLRISSNRQARRLVYSYTKRTTVSPEAFARRWQKGFQMGATVRRHTSTLCTQCAPQVGPMPSIHRFPFSFAQPQLVIPEYCKDPVHPDHPTAGWLRRKKRDKRALTSSFVNRFFRLEYDAFIMRYTLSYGK